MHSPSKQFTHRDKEQQYHRELHLLKTPNALLRTDGMLHLGAGDCVGQTPAVRTLTERFTPLSDILKKSSNLKKEQTEQTRCCHAVVG